MFGNDFEKAFSDFLERREQGAHIFCGKCGFASLTVRLQRGTSPPLRNPQLSEGDWNESFSA